MKNTKKILYMIILCSIMLILLTGCGSDTTTKSGCIKNGYEWSDTLAKGGMCIVPHSDYEPPQADPKVTEQRECSEKTDTYNKCSWSFSENMCVCKRR